jgi:hypothetical protein
VTSSLTVYFEAELAKDPNYVGAAEPAQPMQRPAPTQMSQPGSGRPQVPM